MTRTRRRMPGRRTSAVVLTAAVLVGGLAYTGFQLESPKGAGSHPDRRPGPLSEAAAVETAARTGKPVEVTALRTARSTTWARPDGSMAKKLYSSPVRAKVGSEWKDIDYRLHRTAEGWEPQATNTRVVFSPGSRAAGRTSRSSVHRMPLVKGATNGDGTDTALATLHIDDYELQLTWPGTVPAPIIDGSRALYPEILPGADLVLTADDDGFAQLVVLKNRQAASDARVRQLSYGITSEDLTFRLDPVSHVLMAENAYGNEVATSPTPLMWDSSGLPAVTDSTVGATAQPTEAESPIPTDEGATPEDSASPSEDTPAESDEQSDTSPETLPSATDGPEPTVSESPLPPAPPEPTPAPSQSGSAATLSLPSIDGPSPDSRGDLVEVGLSGANWVFTPDPNFLTDPATTYPVFIDPSVKKHTQNWTTAYSRHPNASFYNGKGFNKGGTHEARVGFESDTWGTSRSFFNIDFDKDLKGTKITSAKLRVLETYAWSCSSRSMTVHLTGAINSHTNWKNAPKLHNGNKYATKSFAHGYKSGCRDAYETFDVKKAAQLRADQGKDSITFGMRASDEHSQYAWKKFQADGDNAPVLELVYNRRPTIDPKALDLGPDAKCTTTEPYVRMGSGNLTFTARASDKDKNLDFFDFDLWPTGKWDNTGDLLGSTGKVSTGSDTDTALRTTTGFSTSKLSNGTLYSWRVQARDDAGSTSGFAPAKTPCRFVLDTSAPKPPKVSSTDFPNADGDENGFGNDAEDANWSAKKFGTPGSFTVRALNTDVVRYECGAYRANPDKDPNGDDLPPFVAAPSGHFKGALITHNGDIYGGDGLQDLVVRVGGKLWVYPGDGYGAVNVDKRREILLPDNAPKPADLSQIVAAGDITGDGRTDFFATSGDALWAFTGYHGATVDQAVRLSASAWTERDIVTVQDISGDGVSDLVYRTDVSARLLLRKGIAASGGGVTLTSLASAANSSGGVDIEYGAAGWGSASIPHLIGTPDVNGDSVPDIWTVRSDGAVRFYAGSKTALSGSGAEIIAPASYWKTRIAIG
ncbi:DNRLRE domain-containing protein [Streptomyces antibioticus]|uniref:VCBS repeat-containing protein n=1 Tax=Streptomyces antibioticus TaxID=1890 RepID=A0AAE7CPE8_STRAT|nr:DNRLRE domain-containing protein [Streptomyces antibioticus]QIT48334.1 VCBS repeat-containing protein [Streptomyces antibioticus]